MFGLKLASTLLFLSLAAVSLSAPVANPVSSFSYGSFSTFLLFSYSWQKAEEINILGRQILNKDW
jgi:hypothetical protein